MFGDNLKTLRKNKGFSQEQLSLRLNVVRQTVSKWEKGLSVPDAEMLVKIAEVLGTSVNELLGEAVAAKNEEGLSSVAMELQKLNELLAMQIAQKKQLAKNI
ncbi:MAG: helix-turn-helix transcriptional regulator, partial [Oscillospiraceae bacterium]|nr:helix-turn-helix transcriptional regulator [Oscillospiraceae bacterium]